MNINLKFLLLGTSLFITNAQCSPAQNCAELGYKETANKGSCLKCPFGNGWYCPCDTSYQYTCTGANEQQGTDKCGNKYKSCTCVSGYEWKDGKCDKEIQPILGTCIGYAKNCKIGDIWSSTICNAHSAQFFHMYGYSGLSSECNGDYTIGGRGTVRPVIEF